MPYFFEYWPRPPLWLIYLSYLLSTRIIFTPSCNKFWKMVRTKNGGVTGEVVETVSDDSHNNVQHNKRTQEDECDEVYIGDRRPTSFLGVCHIKLSIFCVVPLVGLRVARAAINRGHHDVRPSLTSGAPEQHYFCLKNISKVVVSVYFRFWVICNISKHLHSDNGVNKEEHQHQHHHIWKSLKKKN